VSHASLLDILLYEVFVTLCGNYKDIIVSNSSDWDAHAKDQEVGVTYYIVVERKFWSSI